MHSLNNECAEKIDKLKDSNGKRSHINQLHILSHHAAVLVYAGEHAHPLRLLVLEKAVEPVHGLRVTGDTPKPEIKPMDIRWGLQRLPMIVNHII